MNVQNDKECAAGKDTNITEKLFCSLGLMVGIVFTELGSKQKTWQDTEIIEAKWWHLNKVGTVIIVNEKSATRGT